MRSPRCMACAASARRRSPRPTPSAIAAITGPRGGSGRRRNRPCAPTSFRSACAWAGSPPMKRRSRRSRRFANGLRDEGDGLLLIFDNAIGAASLKPYLPPGGAARVLMTSNAHAWRGAAAPVEIRVWPRRIGADYLIARTGRDSERAEAEALSDALGGLPLAHEQAAAYCERLTVSLADYRRRFEAAPVRLLDSPDDAPAEYHERLTVAKRVRPRHRRSRQAPSRRRAAHCPRRAARARADTARSVLGGTEQVRRADGVATRRTTDSTRRSLRCALLRLSIARRSHDERDPAITTETIRLHLLVRAVAAGPRRG